MVLQADLSQAVQEPALVALALEPHAQVQERVAVLQTLEESTFEHAVEVAEP